jgi:hypothetical protein
MARKRKENKVKNKFFREPLLYIYRLGWFLRLLLGLGLIGDDMCLIKNMLGFASVAFLLFIHIPSLLFDSRAKSCTFLK